MNYVMREAGVDMSCRSAASSFAHEMNVPMRKIVEACGWASERTFRNHYSKEIEVVAEETVGEQILS